MTASSSSGAWIPRSDSVGGCRSGTEAMTSPAVPRGERRIASDHLVQDHADAPDVGAVIHVLAAHLFGRHVSDRAEHDAGLRPRDARVAAGGHVGSDCNLGEAEVEQLHEAVRTQHDVFRLDVAMYEAGAVGGVEC